ncbi:MAG TPA: DUF2279 domain-containing protein [Chitinophagaceae bacterium]|nr:DUF2279 domain-containing protein [Chitinophagaceae bacterium]
MFRTLAFTLSCFCLFAIHGVAQPFQSSDTQKKNIRANPPYFPDTPNKKRIWLVAGANVLGYGTTMVGLYAAWYKKYPQTHFHTFNDFPEWKQMDKAGHLYSSYMEGKASIDMWRWTGIGRKKSIWIGGMSGIFYQTVIEVLDGFSAEWGWSWTDFASNLLGSATVISQELGWDEQRIRLKFSFHRKKYTDPQLNARSDDLFGEGSMERLLKDYNGQTYWASLNLKSFFKKSRVPGWLSVAIGYGAEGLFGGRENLARDKNGNIIFDHRDIPRYRQWFFAPDIDLSKIKTRSRVLKTALDILNAFKFPTPSIEFSRGKFSLHAIQF